MNKEREDDGATPEDDKAESGGYPNRNDPDPDDERESPLTVARKWLPWCIALIFVMTVGWAALVSWDEVAYGNHPNLLRTVIAIVTKVAAATPAIGIWAILIVSVSDAIGGFAVVTKRYLERKWVKPLIESYKAEGRAEGVKAGRAEGVKAGRAEGVKEGRAEGIEEANQDWITWNRRRMEAEDNDEPFDDPPPAC